MHDLTARQAAVLEFIRGYATEHGMPPTRAEIVAGFGFASPNAAQAHLRALARRGALALTPGSSRGIRLLGDPGTATLPLVGRVAAGAPILAQQHIESHHPVSPTLFSPRADYLLRVAGDSMIGVGILPQDLLAVHKANEARNGQIVVARLDDEVTVKRFHRRGRRVTLTAANPAYPAIEVNLAREALAIEGLAVGVIRQTVAGPL